MEQFLPYVWIAIAIVAIVLEIATAQLVSIWFVAGSLIALISSLFHVDPLVQLMIFIVSTLVILALTKPIVKKMTNGEKIKTNADRYVGMQAIVTDTIDNGVGKGLANVEGSIWSARSENGEVIQLGEKVLISEIQGVKLIVKKV